ncbi:MAG: EamA family transporter [Candidatus Acetothermia bacterium]
MLIGIFLSLGAGFLSAVGYVAVKHGLESTDYRVFIVLSLFIGVAISAALLWTIGTGLGGLGLKSTLPFIATGGLGGGLLARVSITRATNEIGASKTHAFTSVSPLVTTLFGVLFLGEQVGFQLGVGTGIVVVGATYLSFIAYREDSQEPEDSTSGEINWALGLGLAFYGMVMFGFHPVLRKMGVDLGATPLQGAFVRFTTGFTLYLAYLLLTGGDLSLKVDRNIWKYFLAGVAWALSPIFAIYAIEYVSPVVFASLMRVGPLFTVLLTYLFLTGIEEIDWRIGLNAAVIVIGAIVVSTS